MGRGFSPCRENQIRRKLYREISLLDLGHLLSLSHSSRARAHCGQKLSPGGGQGKQGLPEASRSVCQPLCGPFTSICMREPPVSPPNGSWALQFTEKGTDLPGSYRKSWTGLGFESWCIRTRVLPLLVVPTLPSQS